MEHTVLLNAWYYFTTFQESYIISNRNFNNCIWGKNHSEQTNPYPKANVEVVGSRRHEATASFKICLKKLRIMEFCSLDINVTLAAERSKYAFVWEITGFLPINSELCYFNS